MPHGIIVQLPASGAFGTDEDFDLRTLLERELSAALAVDNAGECGRGIIDNGQMNVFLEAIADPARAFQIVTAVLKRMQLLARSVIVLETRSSGDPDDITRQTLWPHQSAEAACVA